MAEESGSIVPYLGTSWKAMYAFLAAAAGVFLGPGALAALGVVDAGAHSLFEERLRRKQQRLEQVVEGLRARLESLEENNPDPLSDQEVDLFVETVKAIFNEDDERKLPVYEAVLAWIIEVRPLPMHVRIMNYAVCSVSYAELYAFLDEVQNGWRECRQAVRRGIGESSYAQRLVALGLKADVSVNIHGSPTAIGAVLAKLIQKDELRYDPLPELQSSPKSHK